MSDSVGTSLQFVAVAYVILFFMAGKLPHPQPHRALWDQRGLNRPLDSSRRGNGKVQVWRRGERARIADRTLVHRHQGVRAGRRKKNRARRGRDAREDAHAT